MVGEKEKKKKEEKKITLCNKENHFMAVLTLTRHGSSVIIEISVRKAIVSHSLLKDNKTSVYCFSKSEIRKHLLKWMS